MKSPRRPLLCYFAAIALLCGPVAFIAQGADSPSGAANSVSQPEKTIELDAYVVSEKPLGWLGIKSATITFGLKALFGMKAVKAVRIDALEPGSVAERAGFQPGDYIASIDGVPVTKYSATQLKAFGQGLDVGRHIAVQAYRPSTKKDIDVVVVVTGKKA
jgi:membrane-associated protease RseP (regulator of RpoE activity)